MVVRWELFLQFIWGCHWGLKIIFVEIWNDVVGRCDKIVKVEISISSLGGRLTLINSVLDALPTYIMFIFPLSEEVKKRID